MTSRRNAVIGCGAAPATDVSPEIASKGVAARRSNIAPLHLPPQARSAALARRYVRECLTELGHKELTECAILGVDELVANVCRHAHTPLVLNVAISAGDRVRFAVTDFSETVPVRREAEAFALGGRGLTLLDACGTWGVIKQGVGKPPTRGGKTIWFEPAVTMSGLTES